MVMSKAGSEVILKCLMGKAKDIDVENLPWGPEDERVPAGIETTTFPNEIPLRPGAKINIMDFNRAKDNNGLQKVKEELVTIKDEPIV